MGAFTLAMGLREDPANFGLEVCRPPAAGEVVRREPQRLRPRRRFDLPTYRARGRPAFDACEPARGASPGAGARPA